MSDVLRGLTWDHPRGHTPLARSACLAAEKPDGLKVEWDVQPLEGFESHPLPALAEQYDLIILDHPCMGEAASAQCLLPLERVFSEDDMTSWRASTIGLSFDSYTYAGSQWALPIDAATQVCAITEKAVTIASPPPSWQAALGLAEQMPMILSLAGPHATLTFLSVCAQLTGEANHRFDGGLPSDDVMREAYELLAQLYAKSTSVLRDANPIGILDAMSASEEAAFCPLVYGYVNYARANGVNAGLNKVHFFDAPTVLPDAPPTSMIGGTGLAISKRCKLTQALLDYVRFLMSEAYQCGVGPRNEGQPALRAAWNDSDVNRDAGDFYHGTFKTMENGALRPRYPGYVEFQNQASTLLKLALEARLTGKQVAASLMAMKNSSA